MFKESLYPRSGLQRETKELQSGHNYEMCKDFFGDPYDEQLFTKTVTEMFHLGDVPTAEELRNVKLFAEYAIPRLTMSSAYQPHLKRWFRDRFTSEAISQNKLPRETISQERFDLSSGAPLGRGIISHDLIHASVACLDSEGKNLRPKYNSFDYDLGGKPGEDIDCVIEELVVLVIQGEMVYEEMMKGSLSSSQSLEQWLERNKLGKSIITMKTELGESAEELLSQKLSVKSLLRYIEFLGVYLTAFSSVAVGMWEAIEKKRPLYYTEIFQRL